MVGLVLVSHSRALAEAAAAMIRGTVGEGVPIEAAGGVGDDRRDFGTDAADILEAIRRALGDDGAVVLMDMGSAVLSAETARDFLGEDEAARVVLCSAPLIEGGIAAAVQSGIGADAAAVAGAARGGLAAKREQIGDGTEEEVKARSESGEGGGLLTSAPTGEEEVTGESVEVEIRNEHGLHLRPAAVLVKRLAEFSARVAVENLSTGSGPAEADSLTSVAMLQVNKGHRVRFTAEGPESAAVLAAIRDLAERGFGESESPATVETFPESGGVFGVSAGIAIGTPYFLDLKLAEVPDDRIFGEAQIAEEIGRLRAAIRDTIAELDRTRPDAVEMAIFEAHRMILEDPQLFAAVERRIREEGRNAARAWSAVTGGLAEEQAAAADGYFVARAADFRDVAARVLSRLLGGDDPVEAALREMPEGAVLVCDELWPYMVERLRERVVAGVIQLRGGRTSHGAILARAARLPTLGGTAGWETKLREARLVAFDAGTGEIWIDPDEEAVARLERERRDREAARERAAAECAGPAVSRNGVAVEVGANAGARADIEAAVRLGADGVGLFRSEFLFGKFEQAPTEDEQVKVYREAFEPAGNRPITLRLLDVGGDKPLPFLPVAAEANPFLGMRGLRLLLANLSFFRGHLRAILRVAVVHPVRILIPMVTDAAELRTLAMLLEECHGELDAASVEHAWPVEIGAMIEVPSAALLLDQLAPNISFVSLGTNDLTQYTLAAERGHAGLAAFADALHPAVLRLVRRVVTDAAEQKLSVSICGEIASDPVAIPLLLGAGLRSFSVIPELIPEVKMRIREVDTGTAAEELERLLESAPNAAHVRGMVREQG